MPNPKHDIPPQRKLVYYLGLGLSAVGFLMFLSVFISGAMHFGDFTNFDAQVRSAGMRGIGGMLLIISGFVLMAVGSRGLAGSGIIIDPEQARDDLEPWNRMGGGMLNDALDEVDVVRSIDQSLKSDETEEPAVKIRCRSCKALNDEHAKFCDQCGREL